MVYDTTKNKHPQNMCPKTGPAAIKHQRIRLPKTGTCIKSTSCDVYDKVKPSFKRYHQPLTLSQKRLQLHVKTTSSTEIFMHTIKTKAKRKRKLKLSLVFSLLSRKLQMSPDAQSQCVGMMKNSRFYHKFSIIFYSTKKFRLQFEIL